MQTIDEGAAWASKTSSRLEATARAARAEAKLTEIELDPKALGGNNKMKQASRPSPPFA